MHVDPEGKVVDSYNTKIEVGVRGEKYSQRNTYIRDGQTISVKEFFGKFDSNGTLTIETKSMKGECVIISDSTFLFNESGQAEDGSQFSVCEVITLCDEDKKTRMRTNQFVINGKPYKTSTIVEHLVSKDDVYFEEKKAEE